MAERTQTLPNNILRETKSLITTLKAEFADRLCLRIIITNQQKSNLKNRPYAPQLKET
jgi:hypothetical protein